MAGLPHIVIVGGGFGGLYAAQSLARADARITLVDRRNHHLFQPLLYQVATAGLSAPDIATPIRSILRRQKNTTVLLANVTAVDPARRIVSTDRGPLAYDALILAPGTTHTWFGHDDWAAFAPGLKDVEDAFEIRRRILLAFENAEQEPDEARRRAWLTFAIVGAGPTGVELAGALEEIAKRTLAKDFRNFDPASARVVLIDTAHRVLAAFSEHLSAKAEDILEGARRRAAARPARHGHRRCGRGDGGRARRRADGAVGGRRPLLAARRHARRAARPGGRVLVERDLSLPGHPETFVVGDLCAFQQDGEWLPGVAQPAIQEGQHAAKNVLRRLAGQPTLPFRYQDRGIMATIGRAAAVARVGRFEFAGLFAWLLWVGIHIWYLIGFRNRLVVMLEWAWAYFLFARNARVILDPQAGAGTPPG